MIRQIVAALVVLNLPTSLGADLAFRAPTVTSRTVVVERGVGQLTVVCFLGCECPLARLYGPRLSSMADEFRSRNVQFIGVNSNRQDSPQEVRQYVTSLNVQFPVVHDQGNVIADQFQATRTPEVFVLDDDLNVRYHGRIDDQYAPGVSRARPERHDLKTAIEELLDGKPVSVSQTEAAGCIIGRSQRATNSEPTPLTGSHITYAEHVMPVLQQHCLECHRVGDIGPFAMETYDDVAGWADTMLEAIEHGRMPPWHANPEHGHFQNARHMPEADKQVVRDWIGGGLKRGDTDEPPRPKQFAQGWQLERAPDLVVEMRNRPFRVPADGVVEYQYFVADLKLTEDKWVTAAQVIPGSRSVVHHAIVFIRPPDGRRFRGLGWLSAYVPGQRLVALPDNHARFVPQGSRLVFQMHYTPNGEPQEDVTKIGLLFGNEQDITHEVFTLVALNQEFEIPPHTAQHMVKSQVPWLPEDGHLLAATPHMHYRGKSCRLYTDAQPDRVLLDIPQYDFNWQHTYAFADPIPTADLGTLRFDVSFDNSEANPFNPDPSQWVTWGDQTWEEMAVAFFEVSEPRTRHQMGQSKRTPAEERERTAKIEDYVARSLRKLDVNNDGRITQDESPIVMRHFSFHRADQHPCDGVITADELRRLAEQRY